MSRQNTKEHFCLKDYVCLDKECGQVMCCAECKSYQHNHHIDQVKSVSIIQKQNEQRRLSIREIQAILDLQVEDLMRVVTKLQDDMRKLLSSACYQLDNVNPKLIHTQFNQTYTIVKKDFSLLQEQSNSFHKWVNEFNQTQLLQLDRNEKKYCYPNSISLQLNQLNDIQKVIFDNYYDPTINEANYEVYQETPTPQDDIKQIDTKNQKRVTQLNSNLFQKIERIQQHNHNIFFQNQKQDHHSVHYNLEQIDTPTEKGENEDNISYLNMNVIKETQNIKNPSPKMEFCSGKNLDLEKQANIKSKDLKKKRYSNDEKVQIIQALFNHDQYKLKKVIPKDILTKYNICYQTLLKWIKKYSSN